MAEHAASYLRVSGRGQVDGDGFPRQRESVDRRAALLGVVIDPADEFRDEGVSGMNDLKDRPGLAALLDRIESNGIRIVLVENASRIARDLMVQEVILDRFRTLGVRVIECDGGNDLCGEDDDNPTKTLVRQILGAVAQFDKSVLVLKLRAARMRKRRQAGKCEGRKAFGDKPGEADTIEIIKKLRRSSKGMPVPSFARIADELNAQGVKTRTGKPWAPETVRKILSRKPAAAKRK